MLEYDGLNWRLYPSPNHSEVRALHAVGNRIYMGCYGDFGYWDKGNSGRLQFTSLVNQMSEELGEDEEFWNITQFGNYFIFQSLKRLYFYNSETATIHYVEAPSERARLFRVKDRLLFQIADEGIVELYEGKTRPFADGQGISDKVVVQISVVGTEIVMINEDGEFFVWEHENLTSWRPIDEENLRGVKVYSALYTKKREWILGTINKGVIVLDEEGRILSKIDRSKGLLNNTVLNIFEDQQGVLWLGLDNGISLLFQQSAFREYRDELGELGVVYAAARVEDQLFLGTNQGLYKYVDGPESRFELIPGSSGQVWTLKQEGDVLLGGHNSGVFRYQNNQFVWLNKGTGVFTIQDVPDRPDLHLLGTYEGLGVLSSQTGNWEFLRQIPGFSVTSRFFVWTGENTLCVNHEYKGLFNVKLNEDFTQANLLNQHTPYGQSSALIQFRDYSIYGHNNGIEVWDQANSQWTRDTTLMRLLHSDSDSLEGILIPDEAGGVLWGIGQNGLFLISQQKIDGRFVGQQLDLSTEVRQTLGTAGFECISRIGEESYLIGRNEGFLILDITKLGENPHELSLLSAHQELFSQESRVMNIQDLEFDLGDEPGELVLEMGVNQIPVYQEVYYQYRIPGEVDAWSDWTTDPIIRLSGLPIGEYNVEFRSRINTSFNTNDLQIGLVIKSPWYARWWAVVLYILGFLLALLVIHYIYRSYYKKEQERLDLKAQEERIQESREAQQRITQMEYERLQQEMESKNRELAVSTMSMIKKNEFLNEIKKQLQSTDLDEVKPIIRKINRSLSNEDDWKFFENAFNQADQHFLKKIKKTHPDLTSNDLKICAYLRLNLSSKEIAPLLNISVKSVEVKRYRLRKKLGIQAKQSLIDYILEV